MPPSFASGLMAAMRLLGLALLALGLHCAAARAHASLNATQPVDGAMLSAAPTSFSLRFSEPVSPLSLRLVGPDGAAVDLSRFTVNGRTIEITAPAGLVQGTHVLSWRVVSEDGHPVGGSVVFSIGAASAKGAPVEDTVDRTVRAGLWLSKVALYAGLFVGVGGVFGRRVLMPHITAGNRLIAVALALGAAGAISSLGFQGLDALGVPVGSIGDPLVWSTGIATSLGRTAGAALAAFLAAGIALAGRGPMARIAAALALTLAALALALSGHASAAAPQWLMRPSVFLHAAAIAVWIGALAPLCLALRRAEPGVGAALTSFSRIIPAIVGVLVMAGIALAVVQVEHPRALFQTAYGQVFLAKLALLVGLFLLAAFNRWTLTARAAAGEATAARLLMRTIAAEAVIALLIFGVAAAWRFTPPPRALALAAAQPSSTHIHTAKTMADLSIVPGRAGPVDVSAIIMTGDFGPLDAREVTFVFSNPAAGIEPFRRRAQKPGDGTWSVSGVVLPLPGEWTVRIDVLISDFDMARLEGKVGIRP